jgi:hypothetical protein
MIKIIYSHKILLDFNAKYVGKTFSNHRIGNESLHKISNDNGDRNSNLCNIQKSYCQKYDVSTTFINLLGHLMMERFTTKLTIF